MDNITDSQLSKLKSDILLLKNSILTIRSTFTSNNNSLSKLSIDSNNIQSYFNLKPRRVLKGHFGKIYSISWCNDNTHLSSDGKMIIWNAKQASKISFISLKSSWMMTNTYSPNRLSIAVGGLSNICTVYNIPKLNSDSDHTTLTKDYLHNDIENYITNLKYLNDSSLLISYGKGTTCLWDTHSASLTSEFVGHDSAVTCISNFKLASKKAKSEHSLTSAGFTSNWDDTKTSNSSNDANIFITGSADKNIKIWDTRMNRTCNTITGHTKCVNSLDSLDIHTFCSSSDDGTVRLSDIRCMRTLNVYNANIPVTSVVFSKTGRFIFSGCDDYTCRAWDTISCEQLQTISGHEGKVSCVGISENGLALCTASWDTTIRLWA